ncbi:50S ribosomal protein L10 [Chloroflexota bacterium]
MSREKKTQIINGLQEAFSKCSISIFTDYRGLATSDMTTLRRKLQESESEYKVVKNTLARFAAERAGLDSMVDYLEGPIAITLGYGNITAPAKVLASYIRDTQTSLSIKVGFLGNRVLTTEEVMTLSALPSREILIARVLGQMKSPVSALLGCLTTPIRGIIGVLQARITQLEGE